LLLLYHKAHGDSITRRINAENYLVVVRADASADMQKILSTLPKYRVKSQNCTDREQEIVVEVKLSKKQSLSVKNLLEQEGVRAVNTVSYRSQTIL